MCGAMRWSVVPPRRAIAELLRFFTRADKLGVRRDVGPQAGMVV